MLRVHRSLQTTGAGRWSKAVQTVDSWYNLVVGVSVDILSPVFHVEETGNVSTA